MNVEVELEFLDELIKRYPALCVCRECIFSAYEALKRSYLNKGKLLVAGNGGSAADSEHIVGELMKSFTSRRPIQKSIADKIYSIDPIKGKGIIEMLEMGLPAISLVSTVGLGTAYLNDIGATGVYAQQVLGYGNSEDIFLGISTSGNSENIIVAAIVAKAKGLTVISLTSHGGGALKKYSDICIEVPESETYKIQELHLPIYHCLCLMLERYFFTSYENNKE